MSKHVQAAAGSGGMCAGDSDVPACTHARATRGLEFLDNYSTEQHMNTSNELFRLIATMSKQEKRYFKLYTSFYSKEQGNSYMRLFDLIDKEKPANNDALLALVKDEP